MQLNLGWSVCREFGWSTSANYPIYAYNTSSSSQLTVYFIKGATGEDMPTSTGSNTSDFISITADNSKTIYNNENCNNPIPSFRNFDINLATDIIQGEYELGFDARFNDHDFKLRLYNELRSNSEYITTTTLSNFMDTSLVNPIGQFYIVDSLLWLLKDTTLTIQQLEDIRLTAFSLNDAIVTTNIFESNKKGVNEIYLETVATGIYSFTSPQITDLENIAYQCPYSGGQAVYSARGMLALDGQSVIYDESLYCDTSLKVTGEQKLIINLLVFPNPSKDFIDLSYSLESGNLGNLKIIDAYGKIIEELEILIAMGKIRLEMSRYPSGIYFARLEDLDGNFVNQSFCIIR